MKEYKINDLPAAKVKKLIEILDKDIESSWKDYYAFDDRCDKGRAQASDGIRGMIIHMLNEEKEVKPIKFDISRKWNSYLDLK